MGKTTCLKAQQPEFPPWDPHDGRRKPAPGDYFLTLYAQHAPPPTHTHKNTLTEKHTNKYVNNCLPIGT